MINVSEVLETNQMIDQEHLDVRTITMGISLLDCSTESVLQTCQNIYDKILRYASSLVRTGEAISQE